MDDKRIADYFVIAGLPDDPEPVDEDYIEGLNPNEIVTEPITDITVIFPSLGELVPKGFSCIERTPSAFNNESVSFKGYPANLNSGSLRSPEVYLCYRRGKDKPPLVDIGVIYDGKERLLPDAEVVISTPEGRSANVNNTSAKIYLTYRRAPETMPCSELVVTDICVIMQNKGERPPHAFCIISKNLNKGMMGCDVYLCYKKSMNRPPLLSYKAEVLLRYPFVDRKDSPFPSSVAMFCLPMCATIEAWPVNAAQPRPVFSTFVLTVADATEKIYGAGLTFYEDYPEEKLNAEQRKDLGLDIPGDKNSFSVHVNKSICLLSHYPFFDSLRTFVYYLHAMCRTGPHQVPIERYISYLLEEVPFPSPSRPNILLQLSATQSVLLSHMHDSPLPKSGASFRSMLNSLGPENCLSVLLLTLTEQKILIHSLRQDVLTAVVEAISAIIFPFHWQCPFIPLCPLGLCAVLQAPVPFLVGVDSRFFDMYELPADVTCVDLDTNTVTVSEDKRHYLNSKLLAKKPARILKHTLEELQDKIYSLNRAGVKNKADIHDNMELEFQFKRRERMLELEIQEAFLRFMTSVLKGYRSFLLPITKAPSDRATDASSLFDFEGFLRSRDKNYHKFYQLICKTQMFIRFIEERSFVSDLATDTGLAFFDECVDKVSQDETEIVRLVDFNEGNQSDRTVVVLPPEAVGLPPNATYFYDSKFNLNKNIFPNDSAKQSSLDKFIQKNSEFVTPGSPLARRTKQEIKSAKKFARKYAESPMQWAKYLLSTCYSLWFIHLPSYLLIAPSKHMALCLAYEMLVRMAKNKIQPADEVCYRVVMQLCGIYNQPVVAVKVLFEMKRCGITPNAITYGFYNKAVLEAQWPSNVSNSSQLMWNKLRNVIFGVAQFRSSGRQHYLRSKGIQPASDDIDRLSTGSGTSMESQNQRKQSAVANSIQTTTLSPQKISEEDNSSSSNVPTRISSSSDIGYGSMSEQRQNEGYQENDNDEEAIAENSSKSKILTRMGQSFDQWVKSGVNSVANFASLASDISYYSPGSLIMAGYKGDYMAENDIEKQETDSYDIQEKRSMPPRRLNFGTETGDSQNSTLRLLRSVSFGNDTQIMSKLKELKNEMLKTGGDGGESVPQALPNSERSGSVESNGSLEHKVNQFYEPNSREGSLDKRGSSNSREVTPVEELPEGSVTDPQHPAQLPVPKSPSIQIKQREKLGGTEVSPCSPARTPVTQNDPLGALGDTRAGPSTSVLNQTSRDSPKRASSEGFISHFVTPPHAVGNNHNGGQDLAGTGMASKSFHRSSTLPNYSLSQMAEADNPKLMGRTDSSSNLSAGSSSTGGSTTVVNSLSALSSSLKNPFGRYSPARLSFRKAGSSFIESTIGGKKAEALMDGFNQLKSVAAVTAKKKMEELKEAISTNNYPAGRTGPFGSTDDHIGSESGHNAEWDNTDGASNQWASVSESYLDQLLATECSARASFASGDPGFSHVNTPLSGSTQSLLMLDSKAVSKKGYPIALEVAMTTCSLCHSCESLLFDEEIMAGWTAEESNLNTRCPHCKQWEVPFLYITVKDFRHYPMSVQISPQARWESAHSLESINNQCGQPSRRASMMQGPTASKERTCNIENTQNENLLNTSEVGGVSHCVNADSPCVDPLGALAEKSRSTDPGSSNSQSENQSNSVQDPQPKPSDTVPSLPPAIRNGAAGEPFVVPYLSPLVLRKELENVLEHEGDLSLTLGSFADEHPIIYWNLVWFFHRANLTSHLKGLALSAVQVRPTTKMMKWDSESGKLLENELEQFTVHESWNNSDYRNVGITCKWDNPKFHEKFGTPLYMQHLMNCQAADNGKEYDETSAKLISDVMKSVMRNHLTQTCPLLLFHYHKEGKKRHYPCYRDILFLTLVAGGKEFLESYGFNFDREYRDVYSRLRNTEDYESMEVGDTPPSEAALFCRKYFRDLQVP